MNTGGLSFHSAILINLNIMLGTGIFINTVELAKRSGPLAIVAYLCVGVLLLPLILSISKLVGMHPAGGFYVYGNKEIGPWAGFVAAWSYFAGKLASSTIMIHVAVSLIQQIIPLFSGVSPYLLDAIILALFISLNMLNVQTGSMIQKCFMGLKSVPIIFAILCGLFLLSPANIIPTSINFAPIFSSIPLTLYALMGFEAACSISAQIKDAAKNAPRVILISCGLVLFIVCAYQFIFYGALGSELAACPSYLCAFPSLLAKLIPSYPIVGLYLVVVLNLAIASSALGGAYGILFSNNWNLYMLASHGHTFFSQVFTQFNKHNIPFMCVLAEGIVSLLYMVILWFYGGAPVVLQQAAALAAASSYTMCVVALMRAKMRTPALHVRWAIPVLGLVSCTILLGACIKSLLAEGFGAMILFAILMTLGIGMFVATRKALDS